MKTTEDLVKDDLHGKRVLVRSDLNVPLDADKNITDDGRLRASVPTIKALTDAGAAVIVVAHLGRPKGAPEDKYSLAPVAVSYTHLDVYKRQLQGEVTFITVAHRLATIREYDQICYLDAGRIRGKGTFDEVVAQVPDFAIQARLAGLTA